MRVVPQFDTGTHGERDEEEWHGEPGESESRRVNAWASSEEECRAEQKQQYRKHWDERKRSEHEDNRERAV